MRLCTPIAKYSVFERISSKNTQHFLKKTKQFIEKLHHTYDVALREFLSYFFSIFLFVSQNNKNTTNTHTTKNWELKISNAKAHTFPLDFSDWNFINFIHKTYNERLIFHMKPNSFFLLLFSRFILLNSVCVCIYILKLTSVVIIEMLQRMKLLFFFCCRYTSLVLFFFSFFSFFFFFFFFSCLLLFSGTVTTIHQHT